MITVVTDAQGNVVHDCKKSNCEVSWDGYEIATGNPVENRQEVDTSLWEVGDGKAKLKNRNE